MDAGSVKNSFKQSVNCALIYHRPGQSWGARELEAELVAETGLCPRREKIYVSEGLSATRRRFDTLAMPTPQFWTDCIIKVGVA